MLCISLFFRRKSDWYSIVINQHWTMIVNQIKKHLLLHNVTMKWKASFPDTSIHVQHIFFLLVFILREFMSERMAMFDKGDVVPMKENSDDILTKKMTRI